MTPLIVVGSLVVAGVLVWQRVQRERLERAALAPDAYAITPVQLISTEGDARVLRTASALPPVGTKLPPIAAPGEGYEQTHASGWSITQRLSSRLTELVSVPLLAATLGVGLLLVGPTTWVGASLASGAGGTLPAAGPSTSGVAFTGGGAGGGFGGGRGGFQRGNFPEGFTPPNGGFGGGFGRPPGGGFGGVSGNGTAPAGSGQANGAGANDGLSVDSALLKYLEANQGSAKYLFATTSSQTAAPYIIATGKPVMALGGFSGSDQILTLGQLKTLIREGQ